MKLFLLNILFLLLPLMAMAQITVFSDGENQNIGDYSYDYQSNTFTFSPGKDSLNTDAVWYSFGISGYRRDTLLTFQEIADRPVFRPNYPAYSSDNRNFQRVGADKSDGCIIYRLMPSSDTIYTAAGFPYTYTMLQDYLDRVEEGRNVEIGKLCQIDNLNVSCITINANRGKAHKKKLVWIICRQHAFESVANYVMEGMMDYLLGNECDKKIRKNFVFKIVPMVDVASVYNGQSGRMSLPRDYNRDWDSPVRKTIQLIESEIESSAQQYSYHTFWDIHGTYPGGILSYNFSYFDIYGYGLGSDNLIHFWKRFQSITGFTPYRINDDSFTYEGTPSDTWNRDNFPSLRISATLEVDWGLNQHDQPWTIQELKSIGRNMIKAMR